MTESAEVRGLNDPQSSLPPHRLWQPTTAKWFFAVFGLSLAYAVVRYHLVGPVEWRHLPLFVLNKATSLAAVILVASSYMVGKVIRWHDHDKALRLVVIKFCGLMGFFLAAIHGFFSLALLSPAYYGKYFDEVGRLNLQGEIAMSAGVLGLFCLLAPAVTTLPMMPKALGGVRWKRNQRLGYVALLFVLVHLISLGFEGWLAPAGWNGGIPPISLVAVVVVVAPLLVKRKWAHDKHELAVASRGKEDHAREN
jgi:DMSO/TMAO reductase YedYZ heme-binding membrane subunit